MRKSLLKLLGVAVALMLSTTVSAVGMGGINVTSALGQPLKADIELLAIGKGEKDSLVARLASPEAYKSAGVEYPYSNQFKFQIESRADGQPYLKVSSLQPVNDPFVSLLVELTWSSGKLSREYTFLLDPPGYVPEQPVQAVVQAVAPEVQAAASAVPAVPEEIAPVAVAPVALVAAVTPAEQAAPASAVPAIPAEAASAVPAVPAVPEETVAKPAEQPVPTEAVAKPVEQAVPEEAAAKPVEVPTEVAAKPVEPAASKAAVPANNKESLAVKRGDTMYAIAEQYKLTDVSLERMLVAIYRTNAEQFDGSNMNRIKAGKILHLPNQQELESVSQHDAVKEIHAQAADWNVYRQKLASAAVVGNQSQAAQQAVTGKISSSVADKAPVVKESAKEVLKLSKGEAPGEQVGTGGKSTSGQDQKNAAQEDAIAKNKAVKEDQARTALLEKNLADMRHLAQLEAEAAALARPAVTAAATPAVKAVMAASAVNPTPVPVIQPASAVKPATPVAQPKPKQVKQEPSLLDQILDEPLYLTGGAAALLALGGLGFMLSRRKKKPLDEDVSASTEQFGEITGRMTAPVIPSPETGDFTGSMPAAQAVSAPESDNVDPISEADLFLNFGRDAQAEEILKDALPNFPNNHQIHLKLLRIYANREDKNSFVTIARLLQDSGDDDAWQQAVAMGRKLEPGNPMYGGAGTMEDTGSATTAFNPTPNSGNVSKPQASALDFDFDKGGSAAHEESSPEQDFLTSSIQSDDGRHPAQGANMDFDIGQTSTPAVSGLGETMDFDISTANPLKRAAGDSTVAASPISNDMIFDVGGPSFMSAPEISKPADDGGMAFTLDFPINSTAVKSAPVAQTAAAGLAGISLNFDDAATAIASSAGNKDEHWQEVATKLDLAKAYQEMGDNDGAREICEEVIREGDAAQREAAQTLFDQLLG